MPLKILNRPIVAGRKGGFRHLIYFIDGTWLFAGRTIEAQSNIYVLNTLLDADDSSGSAQISYYSRGLGATYGLRKYTSGGFSYGIDEQIADIYINICSNYEIGDKIYIFGFSRGAIVARALTGLFLEGILKPQEVHHFSSIWQAFLASDVVVTGQDEKNHRRSQALCNIPPQAFANRTPEIEFLGVFDSVSGGHGTSASLQRLRLGEGNVSRNVKNAVHILSLDETRSFFRPVLWKDKSDKSQYVEQIWLPGVHSDIGGAYENRSIGNVSLITMIDRILARTDLSFNISQIETQLQWVHQGLVPIHNEHDGRWKLFSPLRHKRTADPHISIQTLHPFATWLHEKQVKWKNKKEKMYTLHKSFSNIKETKWFISKYFRYTYT